LPNLQWTKWNSVVVHCRSMEHRSSSSNPASPVDVKNVCTFYVTLRNRPILFLVLFIGYMLVKSSRDLVSIRMCPKLRPNIGHNRFAEAARQPNQSPLILVLAIYHIGPIGALVDFRYVRYGYRYFNALTCSPALKYRAMHVRQYKISSGTRWRFPLRRCSVMAARWRHIWDRRRRQRRRLKPSPHCLHVERIHVEGSFYM